MTHAGTLRLIAIGVSARDLLCLLSQFHRVFIRCHIDRIPSLRFICTCDSLGLLRTCLPCIVTNLLLINTVWASNTRPETPRQQRLRLHFHRPEVLFCPTWRCRIRIEIGLWGRRERKQCFLVGLTTHTRRLGRGDGVMPRSRRFLWSGRRVRRVRRRSW